MNISDEMIPVCGDFALESLTSYLGDSVALEGALAEAKDSIKTKIGNMKDAVLDKIKKTSKGKDAKALKNDKDHILNEQNKVANAAKESRELVIALKENQISSEEFTERFKAATEAVRISKAMVGIGSTTDMTLQDLQDYTSFLNEAGSVIDEALAGLESAIAPEEANISRYSVDVDESAIEGVWNCAYDAYTRNCESAMEGLNITKKPLTKQEFQAVFNQERVREDENLRNAIAHGKYSRTELVDMGLLKEDSDELGKGEFEQLLVDYEKELEEMKGKDENARKAYVKEHKLPHHLIYCISGDNLSDYEGFLAAAKKDEKTDKKESAEESAKVGSYTIASKAEELEDPDKKTAQVKNNEAEAKKVEESIKTQNKQDKMPESEIDKKAPDKMNKAQESIDDSTFLEMLDEIIELGDEEALAAIEALVEGFDDEDDEEAIEGKIEAFKEKFSSIYKKKGDATGDEKKDIENNIEGIKKKFEEIKDLEKQIEKIGKSGEGHYGSVERLSLPSNLRSKLTSCISDLEKISNPDGECKSMLKHCKELQSRIADSDDAWAMASKTVPDDVSTDKKDMDEAAKKFSEQASIVKEHLVAVKPRYAKDRKGCTEDLNNIMKEVENLLPCASEITDNDEKIKAYDYIAQQRAALQKALDNIPQDVAEDENTEDENSAPAAAVEGDTEDEADKSSEDKDANDGATKPVSDLYERYRKFLLAMADADNKNDDNLASVAMQCRSQAKNLLSSASGEDADKLNDMIATCSKFIRKYGNAIDND